VVEAVRALVERSWPDRSARGRRCGGAHVPGLGRLVVVPHPPPRTLRAASDEFQLLRTLLTNRNKRHRQRRFLVQGVRAIEQAIEASWPLDVLLISEDASSRWAGDLPGRAAVGEVLILRRDLLDELSERDEGAEAVLVARMPGHSVASTPWRSGPLVVAEAIKSPGNLGTIIRTAESLGAAGVAVTGHAADLYDPTCVRASTGAIFAMPTAGAASVAEVLEGVPRRAIGLDPAGTSIDDVDLDGDLVLVAGTEATGLSANAEALCETLVSIPMTGTTDSLNVAEAVAIVLAEIARRRRHP
jgi:TrmH family RNA methyltransferase